MAEKRTYRKRTNQKKGRKTNGKTEFRDEITLLILILISILLLLSIFGVGGKVGVWVSGFLFGMFGFMAYLFPFVLFLASAFYLFNSSNKVIKRKVFCGACFYLTVISLMGLLTNRENDVIRLMDYYRVSRETKTGGGLLGGMVSHALNFLFGFIGGLVILIVVLMILFVIITGKLILSMLKEKTKERLENYKRESDEWIEGEDDPTSLLAEDRPSQNGKRRKAKVVTFMKKGKEANSNSDIKEITMEGVDPSPMEQTDPVMETGTTGAVKKEDLEDLPIVRPKETYVEEETKPPKPEMAVQKNKPEETFKEDEKGQDSIEDIISDHDSEIIPYQFPPVSYLSQPKRTKKGMTDRELKDTAYKIQSTLESFGVHVKMTNISCGPSVTRYEVQPEQGVKISKITSLSDDIKLNLAAEDIRIEAPIPGKAAVGIEVPNTDNSTVYFREMIESEEFKAHKSNLAFAVGKDIGGNVVVSDISKMPHLLIAGATGSGKSVCINTIIMSILYKANPNDVKLIMVDPKVVELNIYNGIPHLLLPVVTDPKKASNALNWAVVEMTNRYKQFAEMGVRDINGYNKRIEKEKREDDSPFQKMAQIVIIVDELSDLMMVAPGEVEDAICRLAQMARAAGIHLILATQRPSVNVITGLIKANVPSRIAFAVSSAIDSRTILDGGGAEKLLGKGDMLFFPSGYPKPVRIQGNFISDKEVGKVVKFIKDQYEEPVYDENVSEKIANANTSEQASLDDKDPYFEEIGRFIIEKDKASIGLLQRVFRIGFNRAARIMDQLCDAGVVGPEEGTKPRKVLMTMEEFEGYLRTKQP